MTDKSLAMAEDDEPDEPGKEVEVAAAKKVPLTVLDDDGETVLNTSYNGEVIKLSKSQAAEEHQTLVDQVDAANAYEEAGEAVYENFFAALEASYFDNVHIHYGFRNWTEYVNAHVRVVLPTPELRRRAVASMSGWGASQRAMAKALSVSQPQIGRDQQANASDTGVSLTETTGIDGRTTKRRGKAIIKDDEPGVIDAEIVEDDGPAPVAILAKGTLPKRFGSTVDAFVAAADSFDELTETKAFSTSKKKLAAEYGDVLVAAANSVLDLCERLGIYDQIGGDVEEEEEDLEEDEDEEDESDSETGEFAEAEEEADADEEDIDEDDLDDDEDDDF